MDDSAPLELTNVRVTRMRQITEHDPLLVPKRGLVGAIEFELGGHDYYLSVSRLEGEMGWTVDACFIGLVPQWSHGIGARYVRTQVIVEPILTRALYDAAEALGAGKTPA